MARTAKEIVSEELHQGSLKPEDSFGPVIHYTLSLHDDEADLGEEVAHLVYEQVTNFYSSCRVEIKSWPAPNHEFNIQLSVWKR